MQKIIYALIAGVFCCNSQYLSAQDSSLTKKLIVEFCNEFSKKDFSSYNENSKTDIGLIIMPILTKHIKEIEKEWGLSYDKAGDFEKIVEKIGEEAAKGCPKFFEYVKNNMGEIHDEDIQQISGSLQRIEQQQFYALVIKTKTGKEEKLWWFHFFEGSDKLVNNPNSLLKKNISLGYSIMEVYDPKIKEYRKIKVIESLQVN